jgi:hypothetical protein
MMASMDARVEFDYCLPDGRTLTVFEDEDAAPYEGWIVRIGSEDYPATKVIRLRDGGTTTVDCAVGQLYSPSKFKGKPATWKSTGGSPVVLTDGLLAPPSQ